MKDNMEKLTCPACGGSGIGTMETFHGTVQVTCRLCKGDKKVDKLVWLDWRKAMSGAVPGLIDLPKL